MIEQPYLPVLEMLGLEYYFGTHLHAHTFAIKLGREHSNY